MPVNIEKNELNKSEIIQPADRLLVERRKNVVIPREARGWLEELERNGKIDGKQTTNLTTSPTSSSASKPKKKTLPATKRVFMQGFNKGVGEVGHWFSIFILRMIKMNPDGVEFKPE